MILAPSEQEGEGEGEGAAVMNMNLNLNQRQRQSALNLNIDVDFSSSTLLIPLPLPLSKEILKGAVCPPPLGAMIHEDENVLLKLLAYRGSLDEQLVQELSQQESLDHANHICRVNKALHNPKNGHSRDRDRDISSGSPRSSSPRGRYVSEFNLWVFYG